MSSAEALTGWVEALAGPGPSARGVARREQSARAPLAEEGVAHDFLRFPGTGGGFVLLDADSPAVFRAGLDLLPCGRAVSRLARELVGAGSRIGLAAWMARERVRVIAPGGPPLHGRFPGLEPGLAFNVASGVPGRDQKTILQLVRRTGEVVAYAKIGRSRPARALVLREARVLQRLARLGVPAPASLGLEHGAHATILVQGAIGGERAPGTWTPAHAAFQEILARATTRRLPLELIPSVRAAEQRLERLAQHAAPDWLGTFRGLSRSLRAAAAGRTLAAALAHGDFTAWNTRLAGGELRAFDWEHARALAPLFHDQLHFVLQQAILVERCAPHAALARAERSLAGAAAGDLEIACGAYLLDVATHDEAIQLDERSPFPQVEWLRRARLELAREIALRLASGQVRAA